MPVVDGVYLKPNAITELESAVAAPNIDDNFDAVYRAILALQTGINELGETVDGIDTSTTTTSGGVDEAFVMAMSGI